MSIKRQVKPRKYGVIVKIVARRAAITAMVSNRTTAIRGIKSVRRQLAIVQLYKKIIADTESKQDTAEVESDL